MSMLSWIGNLFIVLGLEIKMDSNNTVTSNSRVSPEVFAE